MTKYLTHTLTLTALVAAAGAAHSMSHATDPSLWRFNPSDTFNGVSMNGVARILYDSDGDLSNGSFLCSGTLLAGGTHVVTAAHCADNFNVMRIDFGVSNDVALATRGAAAAYINPHWTGASSRGTDIAVIKLDTKITGIRGFNLSTSSAVGSEVLMMGYGTTAMSGSVAAPGWNDWGYGHWGANTFDVTTQNFLDAASAAGMPDLGTWSNAYGEEYVADNDNGTKRDNTLNRIPGLSSNLGLQQPYESIITGGDSGGGDFVWSGSEWLLTGVHSWGWQFCDQRISPSCDFSTLNSGSYGDLMASTAIYVQADWIQSVAVPEPGTYVLMALGLIGVGAASRRRQAL